MQCNSTNVKYLNNIRCLTRDSSPSPNDKVNWQALVETASVAILIIDNRNRVCYANSLFRAVTGYSKAGILRNTDLLPQVRFLQKQANWQDGDKQAIVDREISLVSKQGDRCWLNCSIQTTEYDGQPATLITGVNVTSYKQVQKQVREVRQREEQARSNREFASMVSHELRTPLNVVSFSSNLLQQYGDRWDANKKQEYLNRIQRGIKTIALLIDEVSIISKAETQAIKFEPQTTHLHQFCQTLLEDLKLVNSSKQVNFLPKGNLSASVDKNILQLILTNLIENAVKYSPQGQAVDFIVTSSCDRITFKIKDSGIGIAKGDLEKLFEPFYRGNNVGQLPGTGMGLAVVKKLVDLHHGQISVNSQVGVGTEFIVSLPK